jgi:hypothetical protein
MQKIKNTLKTKYNITLNKEYIVLEELDNKYKIQNDLGKEVFYSAKFFEKVVPKVIKTLGINNKSIVYKNNNEIKTLDINFNFKEIHILEELHLVTCDDILEVIRDIFNFSSDLPKDLISTYNKHVQYLLKDNFNSIDNNINTLVLKLKPNFLEGNKNLVLLEELTFLCDYDFSGTNILVVESFREEFVPAILNSCYFK